MSKFSRYWLERLASGRVSCCLAVLKIGRWGVSKIGVGGVKLAMTEKGARGEAGRAMRGKVKCHDGPVDG